MKSLIHLFRSIEVLFGAAALALLHWQSLIFLSDAMPFGSGGVLPVAALLIAATAVFTAVFRREEGLEGRTAAVLILLAIWQFRDFLSIGSTGSWWVIALGMAVAAGGVTAAFLRGCRPSVLPAAAGYALMMALLAFLTWEMPWELWYSREWSFLFAALMLVVIGIASTVGSKFSRKHIAWLGLIFLAAAGLYWAAGNYDRLRDSLRERYGNSRQTVDGRRYYLPGADGQSFTVKRADGSLSGYFPCDLALRPALLPALLQFTSHNLQVLLAATPLSPLVYSAATPIWVDHVDFLSADPALAATESIYEMPAYVRCIGSIYRLDGPYDLVILTEDDPAPYLSHLTPNGVVAAGPGVDHGPLRENFRHALAVPGPGEMTLYSDRELEGDLKALDANMRQLTMGRAAPPVPFGIIEILYALDFPPPEAPPAAHPEIAAHPDYSGWAALPGRSAVAGAWWWWLAVAAVFTLCRLGRFLAERWSDWYVFFAGTDVGFAAGAGLFLSAAALVQLGLPLYLAATLPGLAALALLPRATPTGSFRHILEFLVWLAPAGAAALLAVNPWISLGTAAAGAMLALFLWRNGRECRAETGPGRLWLGAACAVGLGLLTLSAASGVFAFAAIALLWRRISA